MTQILPMAVAVGAGGALGALARYGVSLAVSSLTHWPAWPATLITNVVGCFAIGLTYSWLEGRDHAEWVQLLLITGLLGAFTTFSTFSLDAMHLIHDRQWGQMAIYIVASVVIGLLAVKAGMWVAG